MTNRTLTGLVRWLGGLDPGPPPTNGSPEFLAYRRQAELALTLGSLGLTVILLVALFPAVYIGQALAGERGYQAGLDVGIGVVAVGYSGVLLHLGRYFAVRTYSFVTAGTWSPPPEGPVPGPTLRRLLISGDRDFLFQLLCGLGVAVVALLLHQ